MQKKSGHLAEMDTFCVLDFYVHESCQRYGIGRQLFDRMIEVLHCRLYG
jgi:alpha-tubulin N-acetyltransferase 1